MKIQVDVTDVDIHVKPGWSKVSIDFIRQLKKLVRECTEAYLTRVSFIENFLNSQFIFKITGCMQESDDQPQTLPVPKYTASQDSRTSSSTSPLYGRIQVSICPF